MARGQRKAKRTARKSARASKRGLKKSLKATRKESKMKRRSENKMQRKARKDTARQSRKMQRYAQREQRQSARLSKRQAKKLERIYGDMTPEEIAEINEIAPYTEQMSEELNEGGYVLQDENDPIEVATRYAYANEPENEIFEDEEVEGAINDAYIEDEEDWEDLEHAEKQQRKAKAFRTIGSILGDVTRIASKYIGGKETPVGGGVRAFKTQAVKSTIGDFFEQYGILLLVGVVLIFMLKK